MSFSDTGLDPRLLRALAKRGFDKPMPVQLAAIPRVLEGKDVVARARTGSGKTLAYLLPALHRVLAAHDAAGSEAAGGGGDAKGSFRAVVLVPTRELCDQVRQEALSMAQHCGEQITATCLVGENSQQLKRSVVTAGHIVVATPAKLAAVLREGLLPPSSLAARLAVLVLDEADLLLSYGYEEDLQLIAPQIPRSCQCLLMSATMSEDVERLTALVLHHPVALNLLAGAAANGVAADGAAVADNAAAAGGHAAAGALGGLAHGSGLSSDIEHFAVDCAKEDRLLYVLAMLRLSLVRKKVLIFVNTVDEGFRLKLFLESFGVKAALLNAELPLNSRAHILQSFNRSLFDFLIATDDVHAPAHDGGKSKQQQSQQPAKRQKLLGKQQRGVGGKARKDEEFGVTRGIDFKGVRTIINYDLPSSLQGYVHRVGRTGRAGESGIAVTLFTPQSVLFKDELCSMLKDQHQRRQQEQECEAGSSGAAAAEEEDDSSSDEEEAGAGPGPNSAKDKQAKDSGSLRPFIRLPRAQVEALRYRGEDVARSITKSVVREARAKELRLELLNSEKLKDYFEEHSAEKQLLRHDKALHKTPQAPHLRHLPAYLRDPSIIQEKSNVGRGGPAHLSHRKRQRVDASGIDPLKAANAAAAKAAVATAPILSAAAGSAFMRATKKGGQHGEELTEMEKRAAEVAKKEAKKRAKAQGPAAVLKGNVRKAQGRAKAAKARRR